MLELLNAGYDVFVIDNFANSISGCQDEVRCERSISRGIVTVDGKNEMAVSLQRVSGIAGKPIRFERCDLLEEEQLDKIFTENKFDAVIHFAALKASRSCAKSIWHVEF